MEQYNKLIPKAFFLTSGVGMANDQDNAFDLALRDAGISECNLVNVSSILPAKAVEIDQKPLTPGEITFCVLSRAEGKSGEVIGAGVGYGWLFHNSNSTNSLDQLDFGIICEHHGHYSTEFMRNKIQEKLYMMAASRNRDLTLKKLEVKSVEVDADKFGSVVAALVFVLSPE